MVDRSPSELRALIRLLGDDDERVASVARAKLLESGEPALPYLAEGVREPDARIRGRSRLLIDEIRFASLKRQFRLYAEQTDPYLDLEIGVFLIASYGYPEVDMAEYRRALDRLATRVRSAACDGATSSLYDDGTGRSLPSTLIALNRVLFDQEGYRGNEDAYYEADNTYLNRVMDRKLGIPISLSTLYLLLGRRLGLPLYGVGLPGHFVVGWHPELDPGQTLYGAFELDDPTTAVWIDPFHRGRVLEEADCHDLVRHLGHSPNTAYLQPAPVRLIIVRTLMNLVNVYRYTNRPQQVHEVSQLIRIMTGDEDLEADLARWP